MEQETQEKALLDKIKGQNEEQLKLFKTELSDMVSQVKSGMIDEQTFNKEFDSFKDRLEGFDKEKFKSFESAIEKMEKILKTQGSELSKFKESGGFSGKKNAFKEKINEIVDTEEFKSFAEKPSKKVSFSLKSVDITNDYTGGTTFITSQEQRVVEHPETVRLNIRDLLSVSQTDLPYLAFHEVYDWDRNITMNTENGQLTESSFKVRESQTDVKRLGTHINLSKRMLKSTSYVVDQIIQKLPSKVLFLEDFQLLWGDNAGNNLNGIFKVAPNFATIINTTVTGLAGAVASVASYDGGTKTLVTFASNQLINNGDVITIANATEASYNASHNTVYISPKEILIELAYVAEADTSAWTFTVNNKFKNYQSAAQEIDVLKVAKTLVTIQEYSANGIVLNPIDATIIETLKGNDEHYIDVQRLENGILTISGVPVVETTAMPAGKFAVGDWAMAAGLKQYTDLTLEFSDSTNEKLTNSVEAIIHEELLFAIYNKYMFVVGDFTTAKAAIFRS